MVQEGQLLLKRVETPSMPDEEKRFPSREKEKNDLG